jgi:hypothetical protein
MPKRLLVTGSRTWDDTDLVRRALIAYGQPGDTLVTGRACAAPPPSPSTPGAGSAGSGP